MFLDGSDKIESAEVDPLTGKTVGSKESTLKASLTREQVALLKSATSVSMKATFNTEDAKRFNMYPDYSIDLKLISDIVYENKL